MKRLTAGNWVTLTVINLQKVASRLFQNHLVFLNCTNIHTNIVEQETEYNKKLMRLRHCKLKILFSYWTPQHHFYQIKPIRRQYHFDIYIRLIYSVIDSKLWRSKWPNRNTNRIKWKSYYHLIPLVIFLVTIRFFFHRSNIESNNRKYGEKAK